MTFFHVATVLREKRFAQLHPTSRLILTILADMANDQGECWPSQDTIANRAGVSFETVKRQIKNLRESGYISSEQRKNSTCVYSLNLPAWEGATQTRSVPAPEAMEPMPEDAPEPSAHGEHASSPAEPLEASSEGDGQGEAAEPSQAHLEASMPVEAAEAPAAPEHDPDPNQILLSEAAHLILDILPSVAWELGDTATTKQVAYRLQRLQAIGLTKRKIKELTADWPDFVHNAPSFVLSQLQQLEKEHAENHMDSRQAKRLADAVERPRLTDRELADERNRQRRRREAILAEQERQIVAREEAEKHARLQREAAAAGGAETPKLDENCDAAAKIRALALSYQAGDNPPPF